MQQDNSTTQFGRVFIWLAWLLALGLLAFVFQDLLETQNNPNTNPQSALNQQGLAEVTLQQNRYGHYVTTGTINEQMVTFLLDTGATEVSIPENLAQQLKLPRYGNYQVTTANGQVTVQQTKIDQLSIGNIFLYNIRANINPGMQGKEILLGMSALKKLEFQQTGKQLILRERHAF
ncbi:MAG: TIGR02281 family clan AA aspartic protease [Gammaproteobacteria bacterium]|nr:MAG: TIGR02281 family clan AA aspartic protease [Gammaproteobacteria bacterium]